MRVRPALTPARRSSWASALYYVVFHSIVILALGCLLAPTGLPVPLDGLISAPAPIADDGRGTPYVVNKSDNICGLDQPRQLTNPAVVDYASLVAATSEYQKIQKDKIDPNSSEGITLMTKARARVLTACESVRSTNGHCSVWKEIRRRDKKAVTDITDAVKRQL